MQEPPRPPTTLDLIGTTPIRDVLRGRLTGRLDIPSAIDDLALPPEAAERIIAAAVKVRIPPLRRPVVAREFAQRAAEWTRQGLSTEQVLARLGPPRRLRGAMRTVHDVDFGVPLARRLRRFAWQNGRWALLSFVLLYAAAAWRFWIGKPTIARNFAAEWNAGIAAIPEADRAWPLYLEVIERRYHPDYFEPWWERRDPPDWQQATPGDPIWPEVLRYLEANRESLAIVREAAARPVVGVPLTDGLDPGLRAIYPNADAYPIASPNPAVLQLTRPELGFQRSFARWLNVDLRAAASEGDADRAAADVIAMLGLARQAREPEFTIAVLSSQSILVLTGHALARTLHDHPHLWSAEQLEALAGAFAALDPPSGRFRITTVYDRAVMIDFLQRAYTDDGSGNGRLTAAGFAEIARMGSAPAPGMTIRGAILGPMIAFKAPSRRAVWSDWDRRLAIVESQLEVPIWEEPDVARLRFPPASNSGHAFYTMLDIILPAMGKAYRAAQLTAQDHAAAQTVLALHRYHAAHNRFPDDLQSLLPEYLRALPLDTVDGQPLRYRIGESQPVLYGLGQDGDDDLGRQAVAANGQGLKGWLPRELRSSAADGDTVYWPPHRIPGTDAGLAPSSIAP